MELWLPVSGFEGVYMVSDKGRVFAPARLVHSRNQVMEYSFVKRPYMFRPCNDSHGYPQVTLIAHGQKRTARVHRLVAEAFIPNPLGYDQVNHLDHNPMNACADNLEWCNNSQNQLHSWAAGRRKAKRGDANHNAIVKEDAVREIYTQAFFRTQSQVKIAETFGVAQITVSNILTKRSWSWLTDQIDDEKGLTPRVDARRTPT